MPDSIPTSHHLSPALLAAYRDQALEPDQDHLVEAHLALCAACLERFTEYESLGTVMRADGDRPVPVKVNMRVAALLESEPKTPRIRPAPRLLLVRPVWAALFAIGLLASTLVFGFPFGAERGGPAVAVAYPCANRAECALAVRFGWPVDRESVQRSLRIDPPVPLTVAWRGDTLLVKPEEPLVTPEQPLQPRRYSLILHPRPAPSDASPVTVEFVATEESAPVAIATYPQEPDSQSIPTDTTLQVAAAAAAPSPPPAQQVARTTAAAMATSPPSPTFVPSLTAVASPTALASPTSAAPAILAAATMAPSPTPCPNHPSHAVALVEKPASTAAEQQGCLATLVGGVETLRDATLSPTLTLTPNATRELPSTAAPSPDPTEAAVGPSPNATVKPSTPEASASPAATAESVESVVGPTPAGELSATPSPTPCSVQVVHGFGLAYRERPGVAARLGCALAPEATVPLLEQPFEYGVLLWRGDTRQVLALLGDGLWVAHKDTWQEGEVLADVSDAPAGQLVPEGRFGKLWRERAELREALGWAAAVEQSLIGAVQEFARGRMLGTSAGTIYVLYADSTWQHFSDPFASALP